MPSPSNLCAVSRLALSLAALLCVLRAEHSRKVLADWASPRSGEIATSGVVATKAPDGWLELRTEGNGGKPAEFDLLAPAGGWDLAGFAEIALRVRNLGASPVEIDFAAVPEGAARSSIPLRNASRARYAIPPGGGESLLVASLAAPADKALTERFVSLVGVPHEFVAKGHVEAARVARVRISFNRREAGQRIAIAPIVARGTAAPLASMPADRIFPLVDGYGQYRHRDWPGKIRSDADLAARMKGEEPDLQAHGRPADWNRFGGWTGGPRLKATGFFRVEKVDGKWWMVDPEGRLFWSNGVVRVGTRVRVGGIYRGTPLPDREHYFTLPAKGSPLAAFFGTQPQATRGYYVGRHNHAVYDHLEANLFRKYGPKWSEDYAVRAQRRLSSWGLNTIANSSDPEIYNRRQTPYTAVVYSAPLGGTEHRLAGSTGNWGKLPDPFDPGWAALMRRVLAAELSEAARDPWCLGFFVDNELHWGDTCHLAEATVASPGTQHAKLALLKDLQAKHRDIAALNRAWGTAHADWNAWLASTKVPDKKRPAVRADLEAFSRHYLEAYFEGCRAAVKNAAPNHLYLGCRFAGGASLMVMEVAVKYCDIVSINRYAYLVDDLALPGGLDRPIVIGEFHFGALDRGPLANALTPVADQAMRANAYRVYLRSALANPRIVGAHWFQYYDQPTTGRFDGENYQTGLVDICDTPYPETIAAVREIAATLYATRAAAPASAAGPASSPGN